MHKIHFKSKARQIQISKFKVDIYKVQDNAMRGGVMAYVGLQLEDPLCEVLFVSIAHTLRSNIALRANIAKLT